MTWRQQSAATVTVLSREGRAAGKRDTIGVCVSHSYRIAFAIN